MVRFTVYGTKLATANSKIGDVFIRAEITMIDGNAVLTIDLESPIGETRNGSWNLERTPLTSAIAVATAYVPLFLDGHIRTGR